MWFPFCIDESNYEMFHMMFPAYCGSCEEVPLNPEVFRSVKFNFSFGGQRALLQSVKEVEFEEQECSSGSFGAENIEIESSNGHEVSFKLHHHFCPHVNKLQVYVDNPNDSSPSMCYYYKDNENGIPCDKAVDSFTAKCHLGWATVSIIGEKDKDFQHLDLDDIAAPECQQGHNWLDFNPAKRCFWQLRVPCIDAFGDSVVEVEPAPVAQKEESECEKKSKALDVLPIPVDSCTAISAESPVKILSQNGGTVKFSVSQVWKGCDDEASSQAKLNWIAVDYIGSDDDLYCSKYDSLECGVASTIEAKCTDGATVVDLYTYEPDLFSQRDESGIMVPTACGAKGDTKSICHFRYIIKCEPSQCGKSRSSMRRLGGSKK